MKFTEKEKKSRIFLLHYLKQLIGELLKLLKEN